MYIYDIQYLYAIPKKPISRQLATPNNIPTHAYIYNYYYYYYHYYY